MLQGFKRMIVNLFNENKKLFYIIGGAILLPIAMIVVVGIVFAFGALLLLFGLNVYEAIMLMILMIVGSLVGLYAYESFGKE
jgi:predicted RND superfamily exporter protein